MPRCGVGEVMEEKNCTNCRHYRAAEDEGTVLDSGECRRFPPVVVVAQDELATVYPHVDAEADCGEWKAAQ